VPTAFLQMRIKANGSIYLMYSTTRAILKKSNLAFYAQSAITVISGRRRRRRRRRRRI